MCSPLILASTDFLFLVKDFLLEKADLGLCLLLCAFGFGYLLFLIGLELVLLIPEQLEVPAECLCISLHSSQICLKGGHCASNIVLFRSHASLLLFDTEEFIVPL